MTRLIADANLPAKLAALVHPVEVYDAHGRALGRFFPHLHPDKFVLEPQVSDAELDSTRTLE